MASDMAVAQAIDDDAAAKADLEARVAGFPYWYHRIDLPHGVVTPGWAPLDASAYRIPERLDGKRVLDVGARDGYWTFEALRRGAAEVVAVDDFSDHLNHDKDVERRAWENFDFCREALGYDEARAQRHDMSIYDIDEARLGRFDVVFFFGALYHQRHPLLALDRLAAVCDDEIFIESAILDDFSPYRGGIDGGYPDGQMVMEFYPGNEFGRNATNWWAPTLQCLMFMTAAAGFTDSRAWKLADQPRELPYCRGFVHGRKPAA